MASEYTTFCLKDLIPIINRTSLDLMSSPVLVAKKQDGTYMTMAEVANQNSLIAMENSGIKLMATALVEQLLKGDPDG